MITHALFLIRPIQLFFESVTNFCSIIINHTVHAVLLICFFQGAFNRTVWQWMKHNVTKAETVQKLCMKKISYLIMLSIEEMFRTVLKPTLWPWMTYRMTTVIRKDCMKRKIVHPPFQEDKECASLRPSRDTIRYHQSGRFGSHSTLYGKSGFCWPLYVPRSKKWNVSIDN